MSFANASIPAIDQAAEAIASAKCVVATTGAGISVESGIPDFRSAGGIWSRYPPEEYASIEAFLENPSKVWALWRELGDQLGACRPNPGHRALADIERHAKLRAVITQNVDNLHQDAGSQDVVEYHGNSRRLVCLDCGALTPFNPDKVARGVPHCPCGGLLKPDVVMFGELIPPAAMLRAESLARTADVVIVVGTSAQVFPAAQLPFTAKERGAIVIEVNTEKTDLTRTITDVFLQGPAGIVLPALAERILRL